MSAEGQVELRFSGHVVQTGNHVNLSAIRTEGEYLWLAGDETATVERLTLDSALAPTVGDHQRSFALAHLVDLPRPPHPGAATRRGRSGGSGAVGELAVGHRLPQPGPPADQTPPQRGQGVPPPRPGTS